MSFSDQLDNGPPGPTYTRRPPPGPFDRHDTRSPASATAAIRSSIARLGENVNQMNRMVSQLGGSRDTHELRQQLRGTRLETSMLVRQTKDSIQLLSNPSSYQNSDWRIQQDRLRKDFEAELKRLKDVSTKSIELEKAYMAKARGGRPVQSASSEDDRRVLEQEERRSLLHAEQEHQREQQGIQLDNMIQYNENLIAERDEDVKHMEQSIGEINDIFKDLAIMIDDQGRNLGNIEDYITSTSDNTTAATEEVQLALQQQTKSRKRTCLLVLILLIAIVVLILIVSHSLSSDVK
eukprot:TRINITY_DN54575_c0_g1_i1.p1 TRINITY_DN54575_c0_g1~~TRINITY_DN54575_c0_g1_i1.p1  ORF type:complete len:293 (-),score=66.14 TRINITY_DN54575_c0_g1_i1:218-1096(-)